MLSSTLAAIRAPRRLIPVVLVAAGLLAAELLAGGQPLAALHSALMCLVFVVVGPPSWRWLFGRTARGSYALRLAVYAAIGAATVLGLAWLVPASLGMRVSLLTDRAGLVVTLVLFWVGGFGLGRDIELELSLERERARNAELAQAAQQAQLLALQSQLDPHFLFNTLNAIAEWCREDPAVAEKATLDLAAMLRDILDGVSQPRWPLARDLALAEDLFGLHHARDPERFSYRVEAPALDGVSVPPLLLLPLAENAMTHGIWAGHRGEVSLEVKVGDDVEVRLGSPGPFRGEREGGHGLSSLRHRLALTWGDAASLEVRAQGERTLAVVRFPR